MDKTYKVLLVEDDINLVEVIKRYLKKWGFEIYECSNLQYVTDTFIKVEPHIVFMDINLPYFDGFYWCKKIRELSNVPIIFISSKDSNMDIIMAMNSGGDDYIQKPFDTNVLIAKLQAIIRRSYEYQMNDEQVLACNNLIIDINNMAIQYGDTKDQLTKNEFIILKLLIENKSKIVTRTKLMRALWNDEIYVSENTLTVNINRLRKKLNDMGALEFIKTKKGVGYIIE